jgi:hypothetical protein
MIARIVACLALAACGPTLGAAFEPLPKDPTAAMVYIFRPSRFVAGGSTVFLGVVQGNVGWSMELHNGSYIAYRAEPGPIVLTGSALSDTKAHGFAVRAGDEYYIRVEVDSLVFTEVPANVGSVEIRETRAAGGTPKRIATSSN